MLLCASIAKPPTTPIPLLYWETNNITNVFTQLRNVLLTHLDNTYYLHSAN